MYIWLGINVHEPLIAAYERAKEVACKLCLEQSCTTLPFHVSLKISFPVTEEQFDSVVDTVEDYFSTIRPFSVEVAGMEVEDTIAWIRMRRNPDLDRIHDDLNRMLLEQYGVPLHEYDTDYKYHTTLFMDDDPQKIAAAAAQMDGIPLPDVLTVNRLLLGCSPTGKVGTYRVYREYPL